MGITELFYILIVMVVMWLSVLVKTHREVH